jgi:tetratricopeptide (TPR) repeat protein
VKSKNILITAVMAALLLTAGCARVSKEWLDLEKSTEHERIAFSVPFFPQDEYQCGPAAMAMVLNDKGLLVTPEELKPVIYTPSKNGSLQSAMISGARRYDMVPYVFYGPETLLSGLKEGIPSIVLLNLGLGIHPVWHYAVVLGIDFESKEIIMHSGTKQYDTMKLATFDKTWARSNYWGLFVLEPGEIPAKTDPLRYVQTVSAFENTGKPDIALRSYKAAYERWQDDPFVMLGLANAYYAMKDLRSAENILAGAAAKHSENGEILNNYAYILFLNGKSEKAEEYARKAVALGGKHLKDYEDTLNEIISNK